MMGSFQLLTKRFEMNLNNVTGISCKIKEADANALCKSGRGKTKERKREEIVS